MAAAKKFPQVCFGCAPWFLVHLLGNDLHVLLERTLGRRIPLHHQKRRNPKAIGIWMQEVNGCLKEALIHSGIWISLDHVKGHLRQRVEISSY